MALTSTVAASPMFTLGVTETINGDAITNQVVAFGDHEIRPGNLSSTTTPPVSVNSQQEYALAAGTKTIDLQALATLLSATTDCSGKKLQGIRITNVSGNAALTVSGEGANGYSLGGAITIPAASGGNVTVTLWAPESLADVASGDRYLVFTGSGSQTFYLDALIG